MASTTVLEAEPVIGSEKASVGRARAAAAPSPPPPAVGLLLGAVVGFPRPPATRATRRRLGCRPACV